MADPYKPTKTSTEHHFETSIRKLMAHRTVGEREIFLLAFHSGPIELSTEEARDLAGWLLSQLAMVEEGA